MARWDRPGRFFSSRRVRTVGIPLAAAGLFAGGALSVGGAAATPPSKATSEILAQSVVRHRIDADVRKDRTVVTQHQVLAPGGSTGWHSHPGPVVVSVVSGSLTVVQGNDRSCRGHTYTAGQGFFDPGGDVHIAINRGTVPTAAYAVYFNVGADGAFRIDAPNPGHCDF